jgi:hypothetical protein
LLSRRGRSLPANAGGCDTHRDLINSCVGCTAANKLSEDQRQLAWEVAKEQFGADASVAAYLRSRVPQLQSVADLQALGAAITQRIDALTLFTLYVETPGTRVRSRGWSSYELAEISLRFDIYPRHAARRKALGQAGRGGVSELMRGGSTAAR